MTQNWKKKKDGEQTKCFHFGKNNGLKSPSKLCVKWSYLDPHSEYITFVTKDNMLKSKTTVVCWKIGPFEVENAGGRYEDKKHKGNKTQSDDRSREIQEKEKP